jgi:hypothetical protein
MALKQKGIKAGPKKQAAKSEAEAIRAAVEEHSVRSRATRKSSGVKSYHYKQRPDSKPAKPAIDLRYAIRVPKVTALDLFKAELPEDEQAYAETYWHMQCEHAHEVEIILAASFTNGNEPVWMECPDCGLRRRWDMSRAQTKVNEWTAYCPDGFDMFDWIDLYVKDRSLWRYIYDECQVEMVENSFKEDANGA